MIPREDRFGKNGAEKAYSFQLLAPSEDPRSFSTVFSNRLLNTTTSYPTPPDSSDLLGFSPLWKRGGDLFPRKQETPRRGVSTCSLFPDPRASLRFLCFLFAVSCLVIGIWALVLCPSSAEASSDRRDRGSSRAPWPRSVGCARG